MKKESERYDLLSKEVQYIIKYIPNWEIFDFKNLQKSLDEMKDLQKKLLDEKPSWKAMFKKRFRA